jgi:hypothetical protein
MQLKQGRDAEQRPFFFFEINHAHPPVLDLSSSDGLDDRHRRLL